LVAYLNIYGKFIYKSYNAQYLILSGDFVIIPGTHLGNVSQCPLIHCIIGELVLSRDPLLQVTDIMYPLYTRDPFLAF